MMTDDAKRWELCSGDTLILLSNLRNDTRGTVNEKSIRAMFSGSSITSIYRKEGSNSGYIKFSSRDDAARALAVAE